MRRFVVAAVASVIVLAGCRIDTVLDEDDLPPGQPVYSGFHAVDALPGGGFVAFECGFESSWGGNGIMAVRPGQPLARWAGCRGESTITTGPDGLVYVAEDIDPGSWLDPFFGVTTVDVDTGARTTVFDSLAPPDTWQRMGEVAVAPDGDLYVGMVLSGQWAIHRVTGPTSAAEVPGTAGLGSGDFVVASDGTVTSLAGHRVVEVSPTGTVSVVAGTGVAGFSGDGGPAGAAQLAWPTGLDVTALGELLIADLANHRVRKVRLDGTISTIAGGGDQVGDGGLATSAALSRVSDVAAGPDGCVWIAEPRSSFDEEGQPGGRIRQVGGQACPAS